MLSHTPCLYGMHSDTFYFTARTVGTRVRIPLHVVYNVYAGDGHMYVETLHVASPVLQRILPLLTKKVHKPGKREVVQGLCGRLQNCAVMHLVSLQCTVPTSCQTGCSSALVSRKDSVLRLATEERGTVT
jgi:hypothetical protein